MEYLFVYGTLLSEFDAEVMPPLQAFMQIKDKGFVKGHLYNLGEYPGFVEVANAAYAIKGEVYYVNNPQKVFAILDKYEGPEYSRKRKLVKLQSGKNIRCWVYVYIQKPAPQHDKILSGDYLAFIRNKG